MVGVSDAKEEATFERGQVNGSLSLPTVPEVKYGYYFQLFATAPYFQPETIRTCVEKLTSSEEYDSCFTATENTGWSTIQSTIVPGSCLAARICWLSLRKRLVFTVFAVPPWNVTAAALAANRISIRSVSLRLLILIQKKIWR